MSKSNYDIKIGFNMATSPSWAFGLRFFKFKLKKFGKVQCGFLLIELMMAIFIGLVLISSLMRLQSLLLELQDSFYMRDKALVLAIEYLERDCLAKSDSGQHANESAVANNGRDFRLTLDQSSLYQMKLITKIKVEWKSLVGKNCCLEI